MTENIRSGGRRESKLLMSQRDTEKIYSNKVNGHRNYFREYSQYLFHLLANLDFEVIENVAHLIIRQARKKKTVYFIGNGGSATTAAHFAIDFTHAGALDHEPIIRAINLAENMAIITALGNDRGYDQVFARQLKTLGSKGDILIAISASGNSPNVVEAVKLAKKMGITSVGILGFDGGELNALCDYPIVVRTKKGEYGVVEDIHLFLDHMLASYIGLSLREKKRKKKI